MKVLIAQLATETNTFAAFPTGLGAYEEYGIFHGDASRKAPTNLSRFVIILSPAVACIAGGSSCIRRQGKDEWVRLCANRADWRLPAPLARG